MTEDHLLRPYRAAQEFRARQLRDMWSKTATEHERMTKLTGAGQIERNQLSAEGGTSEDQVSVTETAADAVARTNPHLSNSGQEMKNSLHGIDSRGITEHVLTGSAAAAWKVRE